MINSDKRARIENAIGDTITKVVPLSGGSVATVCKIEFRDRRPMVAKFGGMGFLSEATMLSYLAAHTDLPVPEVHHADEDLLLLGWLSGRDGIDAAAQEHAAQLFAALHNLDLSDSFGFSVDGHRTDTVIAGLPQPNPPSDAWIPFFAEYRLMHMALLANEAGQLPNPMLARIETLCGRLDKLIDEPERPSLIHGDAWGGNILCDNGRVTGVIDPAIYFADPEIELAFSTLFNTFSSPFFEVYEDIRPIKPGFVEARRDLYNLYPLLVHVRLFGASYLGAVKRILDRFA